MHTCARTAPIHNHFVSTGMTNPGATQESTKSDTAFAYSVDVVDGLPSVYRTGTTFPVPTCMKAAP